MTYNKILIIGIGLIGGSILKDVKANKICRELIAYDKNQKDLEQAYKANLIDYIPNSLEEAISQSDLLIICTPLLSYKNIFRIINKLAKDTVLITDIGSVKNSVIESAREFLSNDKLKNFIASHPIAGSEKSGFSQARNNLFKNKNFYVTPIIENSQNSIDKICQFWQNIGSNIIIEDAKKHDEIFALSSHIPHLISFCAAKSITKISTQNIDIIRNKNKEFSRFIRLAYSNSKMWSDIFISNKQTILSTLDRYYISGLNLCDQQSLQLTNSNLQKIISFRSEIEKSPCPQDQSFHNLSNKQLHIDILPLLISAKIVEPVMNIFDEKIVGAGFLGMTKNLVNINFSLHGLNNSQINNLNIIYAKFIAEIEVIYNLIATNDSNAIHKYLLS